MNEINKSYKIKSNDEIGFDELAIKIKLLLIYLKAKWLIISLGILFGAIIGFTYAFFQKPIYTATLSFALEDEKTGGGALSGALGIASTLGIEMGTSGGGAFSGANLMELMKSRSLVEKALLNNIKTGNKTQSLADYFIENSELGIKVKNKKELEDISYKLTDDRTKYSRQKDSLLGVIFNQVAGEKGFLSVVQKDKKVSIINVEVKTQFELFSKILSESIVKEVSEFYINTKSKKARINVEILQKQADSIRIELNSAINGVASAIDNTFNLNMAMNIRKTPSAKRQIDVQANTAILTQLVTNLEMAKVSLLKETPLIQIIDKPILPLKKDKISKLLSLVGGALIVGFGLIFFYSIIYFFNSFIKKEEL